MSLKKNTNSAENTESLLGVDYKNLPNKGHAKFHNRRQFQTYQEEETKFVKSVVKNTQLLQNLKKLQPKGCLVQHEINCSSSSISVRYSSPLQTVSTFEMQRHKCEDLIKDLPNDSGHKGATVIGVNLKWKNGVKVKQTTGMNGRNVTRESNPSTTHAFDYESKTKFKNNILKNICNEFFADDNVIVLDGNECHGMTATGNSQKGQAETEVVVQSTNYYNYNEGFDINQVTTIGEYIDSEERKLLIVPFHSKNGLDTDTDKRYIFPYTAKFTIATGKEKINYEHSFQLQLALTQAPQHYGLVFTFPINKYQIHIIKSLISVYSIYPESAQKASLTTYDLENEGGAVNIRPKPNPRSLVANFASFLESYLEEEKLVKQAYANVFSISCDLSKTQNNRRRQARFDHLDAKHKSKQELLQDIKAQLPKAGKNKVHADAN